MARKLGSPLVALVATVALLYLALAPAVVNGDGLGYLKAALEGTLYPGHLAYVPLLVLLRRLVHAGPRAVDGLVVARVASAVSGALAAAALGATARRLARATGAAATQAGLIAAAGLVVSYGAVAAGSDVESYAPALAALCGALFFVAQQSLAAAIAGGICLGLVALLHVENVLFGLPMLLLAGRRRAPIVVAVATMLVGGAYACVLPAHGAAWLGGASHGLHYPLRWSTPLVALYGACKALVYSPYPYEASWPRVLGCFAVGGVALALLVASLRGARPLLSRAVVLAWLVPYALVGLAFYASDAERWTFLLPLVWLAVATTPHPRRVAVVIAGVALANACLWLPVARDDSLRRQARLASAHLRDGDLVVGPGHGWDEYLGFYEGPRVEPFPLVYFAGKLGGREALARALADAAARAPRVAVARFADDGDPMGWKELALFGITRANARALLPAGTLVDACDGVSLLRR